MRTEDGVVTDFLRFGLSWFKGRILAVFQTQQNSHQLKQNADVWWQNALKNYSIVGVVTKDNDN